MEVSVGGETVTTTANDVVEATANLQAGQGPQYWVSPRGKLMKAEKTPKGIRLTIVQK
jgi:hypothetical protein